MSDTTQQELGTLFNRRYFELPDYQRGYSWGEKQIADLINDIEYHRQTNDDLNHYFGTAVFYKKPRYQKTRKIVDGQQRIATITLLATCIYEELQLLKNELEASTISGAEEERLLENIEYLAHETRKEFVRDEQKERYKYVPDKFQREIYLGLIRRDRNDPTLDDCDAPSKTLLVKAKKQLQDWIADKRSRYKDDTSITSWIELQYNFLDEIISIVGDDFEITVYVVNDSVQAGRMFGIINDRGKGLNIADKVKSYLAYQAARMNNKEMVEKIYDKFNEISEDVAGREGGDKEINEFMRSHWRLFTGQSPDNKRYDGIDRQIKKDEQFLPHERDEDGKITWINAYLNSISTCSTFYEHIQNPIDKITPKNEGQRQIQQTLYIAREFSPKKGLNAFLMSVLKNASDEGKLIPILRLHESLIVTAYGICNEGATFKHDAIKYAYKLEWADRDEKHQAVFNTSDVATEDSVSDVVANAEKDLRMLIAGKMAQVTDLLTEDDVLFGHYSDNWSGVGKPMTRYLLFEYEKHLSSEELTVKHFDQDTSRYTLEHIHPEERVDNTPLNEYEHEHNVNKLGDLALIESSLNSQSSNKPFSDKRLHYQDSSNSNIRELLQEHEWGIEQINTRMKTIIDFVEERWTREM